jgi:hypothetical protein
MAIKINDQFMCLEIDGAVVAFARKDRGGRWKVIVGTASSGRQRTVMHLPRCAIREAWRGPSAADPPPVWLGHDRKRRYVTRTDVGEVAKVHGGDRDNR